MLFSEGVELAPEGRKRANVLTKRKKIFNLIFLMLVFVLTLYSVFKGEDLSQVFLAIRQIDKWYLLPAAACVVFFIWGESVIIYYMMGTFKIYTRKRTCFLYSCVGFFFSGITPSASGGQPMQIYYMHKNKIRIPIATLVLMIVTITYKSILVFIGLFLMVFQQGFIRKYLTGVLPVFYLGVALNVFCCAAMLVLVFHPALAKNIMLRCLTILEQLHLVRNKPSRTQKLNQSMDIYNETAAYLKQHILVIINVVLITFVQRFVLFFVTWFVYKAFGLSGTSMYDIVMLQGVISLSVDMLPLPGGMGISENLFLIIFAPVFTGGLILPAMVLSRGIAYYVQLLLSALLTVVAHLTITGKGTRGTQQIIKKGKGIGI